GGGSHRRPSVVGPCRVPTVTSIYMTVITSVVRFATMTQPGTDSMPPPTTEPLVEMRGVNKFFGELHVLKDIDLTVHRGEVVVVIGPSGSGKSTLCRTVNRLETISSGEIVVDGTPLPEEGKALARLRADVGMVFQSFNLFAHKTVL